MKRIALAMAIMAALSTQAQKPAQDTTQPKQYAIVLPIAGWQEFQQRIANYANNVGNSEMTTAEQAAIRKDARDLMLFIKETIEKQMASDTTKSKGGKK